MRPPWGIGHGRGPDLALCVEREDFIMMLPKDFFDLEYFEHTEVFMEDAPVWSTLDRLKEYLSSFFVKQLPLSEINGQIDYPLVIYQGEVRRDLEIKPSGSKGSVQAYMNGEPLQGASIILPGAYLFDDKIQIGSGTVVEPGALIKGPVVIGNNTEVRQGAYIRGNCLIGNGCVVGHTTEIKGSILLDGAKAGHFAYIGDSILGNDVNLGAGTKLANLKMISGTIFVRSGKQRYNTERHKLGAIMGDRTETGCNSVTSPGTLLGRRSIIYPCVTVPGGHYLDKTIVKPSKASLMISGNR
ncbi:MAG: hypothetical protein SWO11_19120 [Thermodesulfobacteriota bacterium]|nr:hypothetical protein [Thermodesulfobacteriota bacterium]